MVIAKISLGRGRRLACAAFTILPPPQPKNSGDATADDSMSPISLAESRGSECATAPSLNWPLDNRTIYPTLQSDRIDRRYFLLYTKAPFDRIPSVNSSQRTDRASSCATGHYLINCFTGFSPGDSPCTEVTNIWFVRAVSSWDTGGNAPCHAVLNYLAYSPNPRTRVNGKTGFTSKIIESKLLPLNSIALRLTVYIK
jgi:hypothetical protein